MEIYRRRSLIVTEGPNQGSSYPLESAMVTLGRATDNAIVLDSSKVSRHHARIRLSSGGAVVEDLGSTNGTWVNGERIFEPRPLIPGDIIRLADYVAFRYVAPQQQEGTAVMPQSWEQTPGQPQAQGSFAGQNYGYGQPQTPAYSAPSPVQPYVPPLPVTPAYAVPRPAGGYIPPSPMMDVEEPTERQRSKWMYVLIGLLAIMLCLCIALAVYIWFAPPSFWEWLFDLFGLPLPEGYPDYLGVLWFQ